MTAEQPPGKRQHPPDSVIASTIYVVAQHPTNIDLRKNSAWDFRESKTAGFANKCGRCISPQPHLLEISNFLLTDLLINGRAR